MASPQLQLVEPLFSSVLPDYKPCFFLSPFRPSAIRVELHTNGWEECWNLYSLSSQSASPMGMYSRKQAIVMRTAAFLLGAYGPGQELQNNKQMNRHRNPQPPCVKETKNSDTRPWLNPVTLYHLSCLVGWAL